MSLISCPRQDSLCDRHVTRCEALLNEGMSEALQKTTQGSLLANAVFMPSQLMCLLIFQLQQDITHKSLDILDTYLQYMSSLVSICKASPV